MKEDKEIEDLLAEKAAPIITIVDKAIEVAIKEHTRPKVLMMSVQAFLTINYAFRGELFEMTAFGEKEKDLIMYKGLQVVVNHNLKNYDIHVLGSAEDEIGHISNFNPPKEKPWNFSPLMMINAIKEFGEEIQVREINTQCLSPLMVGYIIREAGEENSLQLRLKEHEAKAEHERMIMDEHKKNYERWSKRMKGTK